ncbi:MAG: hypothetical protein ACLQLC_10315 [Candidatus Sulfotelmatobacter sp.]
MWKPAHGDLSIGAGMQTATSEFRTYNHNLKTDLRISHLALTIIINSLQNGVVDPLVLAQVLSCQKARFY